MTRFFPALILGLLLAQPAQAGGNYDFADEAERYMDLSFELDTIEGMLAPAQAQQGQRAQQSALPLEPNSEIDAVTVFRDRAVVTRVIEQRLDADAERVVFEGLPLGIDANSLQAAVRGGGARIIGVELVSGRGEVEEGTRSETIREEALGISQQLGEVRDRIEGLLAERTYLRNSLLATRGDDRPQLDEVRQGLAYVGETERRIAGELRELRERAGELDEELQPLLVKLRDPDATGKTVRVELAVERGVEAEIALTYQVFGASWTPSYNARLAEEEESVSLEYFGVVRQSTGEDWSDVRLMLSTANPASGGELPRLTSWILGQGVYDDRVSANAFALGNQMDNAFQAPGGAWMEGNAPASSMSAQVAGTAGAVVFGIEGSRSVAGDGSAQRLPIGTAALGARMELMAAPKLAEEVYRRARITYDGEVPLLAGPVSSFVGGDFVGNGNVGQVAPGEELLLSFGVDDRIRVRRQLVERLSERVGMGPRRSNRVTLAYRTTITNFSDSEQTVQLVDHIPVTQDERVQVRVIENDGALPHDDADGPGITKWLRTLAAGAETTVSLTFAVTAPEDYYLGL